MLGLSFNHRIFKDVASQRWEVYSNKSDCAVVQPDNTGSFLAYGTTSGSVELWDIRSVPVALCSLPSLPFVTPDLQISNVCFSNDCTHIAVFACRKKPYNMGKKQYFTDNHSRQIFICSLSSSKIPPEIIANFSLPFTISHMSFLGSNNSTLVIGASEGKRGRFLLSVTQGPPTNQPASCTCRELLIEEKSGKLSLSSNLDEMEILAASSSSSSSPASSSSFAVHEKSLFTISESRTMFEHSLSDTFLASPQPIDPAQSYPQIFRNEGGVALSVPASVSLSLLPLPNHQAHLLIAADDQSLQVISLQGKCIFNYTLDHIGATILTASVVSVPGMVSSDRGGPASPPSSEQQLAVAIKRVEGTCRVLVIDKRNVITDSVDIGKQIVPDKITMCTVSPNPIRTHVIFGIDHRDSCCSFSFKFRSDFPGPMYPVAFTLLKMGITYSELEDELDLIANGQPTSEVLQKDPMLQMLPADVEIDIGGSIHEISTSRRSTLSKLYFDENQLRFDQPASFTALSTPMMQEDVLDVSGSSQLHLNSAWGASGTGNSKKAILPELGVGGYGVLGSDTDPSITSAIKGSMAQFLRPSGRILIGEYNRKLVAQMKSGDEIMKICEDEGNSSANSLDHFVPIPNPPPASRASAAAAASTTDVSVSVSGSASTTTASPKQLTPLSGEAYIEKMKN